MVGGSAAAAGWPRRLQLLRRWPPAATRLARSRASAGLRRAAAALALSAALEAGTLPSGPGTAAAVAVVVAFDRRRPLRLLRLPAGGGSCRCAAAASCCRSAGSVVPQRPPPIIKKTDMSLAAHKSHL